MFLTFGLWVSSLLARRYWATLKRLLCMLIFMYVSGRMPVVGMLCQAEVNPSINSLALLNPKFLDKFRLFLFAGIKRLLTFAV